MQNNKIRELFYKNKDYSKIKELLKDSNTSWSFNLLGKIALYELNANLAFEYFNKAGNLYGCAYSKFMQGDITEARILLTLIKEASSAANWLYSLITILYDQYYLEPSYFQIRNFYEQDLEMLFLYQQDEITNGIINKSGLFFKYNREIYKYTARVLQNNRHFEEAKILLKKSLEVYYQDPETHFLLGEIYENNGDTNKAIAQFQKAIDACPNYMPAMLKINHLTN